MWFTDISIAVELVRNNMAARQNDLRLYLDVISDPGDNITTAKVCVTSGGI